MASYVIAGASRGIGYEFIRQLSQNNSNTVIGLVRNKSTTDQRLAKDGITNVVIYEADITDVQALQKAAAAAAGILGTGGLDYLINNAAVMPDRSALVDMSYFEKTPEVLNEDLLDTFRTNVIGVANAITAFLPLIKQSKTKKVITLSSGMADLSLINDFNVYMAAPYSASKAAVNVLIAKYHLAYAAQAILFMAISPGVVDTSEGKSMSAEDFQKIAPMFEGFKRYEPTFAGPITPQESVQHVLKLATRATVEEYGGRFVSHWGNERWL